ncbi:phage portal protein [Intestinibacter sp.]|jgi:HK97 family phage portal protein|uniref:phage portal protein n=1 Tax=Intestinibacter sp. TaxID=1965304 RepID=UPI00307D376F
MGLKSWLADFLGKESKPINELYYEQKIPQVYYKELAIQTAISLIANAISKCEIKVFEKGKEVKNKTYYELNIQPNKNESSSQMWHKAIEKMFDDECIIVSVSNELHVANNYYVDEYPILGNVYKGITIGDKNVYQLDKTFKYNEVFRLKLNDVNIKNLINGLANDYEDLLELAIKKYKSSNQQKYILELDNIKANDTNFQKTYKEIVQQQLKSFMENDNAVYPQFRGYKLNDISGNKSATCTDFKDIRKDMFEVVAQAFQIPLPLMFGDVDNLDTTINQFLTFCIDPIADMMSEELTRKIYGNFESWNKGNYIVVDTSSILHIDVLDIADKADKLIASGICSIDEARKIIGFNALDEEYSTIHFMTKNYDTAENMLNSIKNNEQLEGKV